ncbi:neutral zinc metallopeptidase [Nocardia sp. NPDC005366]|uniref:neutral zinc metallopeptidase n=1 Tax=Nocardia sp. NPDC005366 TaxID=3156878 RepID=UPI0033B1D149
MPLTTRWDRMRRGRRFPVLVAYGVVGILTAAALVATGRTSDPKEMRGAHQGSSADGVPGFHGAVTEAPNPAGDSAPPTASGPLAGVAQIGVAPIPSSRAVSALVDHPLFAQHIGLERVDCALPRWRDDALAAQDFYEAAIGCLDASWEPTLRGAGLPFRSPRVLAPEQVRSVSSPCEPELFAIRESSYCAIDETIVLPFDTVRPLAVGSRRGAQLAAVAREYGHHIQTVIGLTRAYADKRAALGWNSAAGQEQGRRWELQAGCFSGMFLGTSFDRGDIDERTWNEAARVNRVAGDRPGEPRVHGTDANVWGWWKWGSDKGDTWECNTWYAARMNVD